MQASRKYPFPLEDVRYFNRIVKEVVGIDPEQYKVKPFFRRVAVRMRATHTDSLVEYAHILKRDPEEVRKFLDALTINVSKFFRNWETFRFFRDEILPSLFSDRSGFEVWSAGCAGGEEAYSLAMLFDEYFKGHPECWVKIWGTDIDRDSLARAETGVYHGQLLDEVPERYLARYFVPIGNGMYKIKEDLKRYCSFQRADLIEGEFKRTGFRLIFCRNVLIYFKRDFQERLFREFFERLEPGGFLVLGKVEGLCGSAKELFSVVNIRERIYRKEV